MLTTSPPIKNTFEEREEIKSKSAIDNDPLVEKSDYLNQNFSRLSDRSITNQPRDEIEHHLNNQYKTESSFLGLKYGLHDDQSFFKREYKEAPSYHHFLSPTMQKLQDSNNFAVPLRSNSISCSNSISSKCRSRASSVSTSPIGSSNTESPSLYLYSNSSYQQRGRKSGSISTPFSVKKRFQEYPMADRFDHTDQKRKEEPWTSKPDPSSLSLKSFPLANQPINRKESNSESMTRKTRGYPRSEFSNQKVKENNTKVDSQDDSFQPDSKLFGYTCLSSIIMFIAFYTLPPLSNVSLFLRSAMGATTSSLSLLFLSIMISYHLSLHRHFFKTKWIRLSKKAWFQSSKHISFLLLFSYFSSTLLSPIVFNIFWILDRRIPLVGGLLVAWLMGVSTFCIWITTIIYTYRLGSNITKPFFLSTSSGTATEPIPDQVQVINNQTELQPKLNLKNRTAVHTSAFQDFKNGKFGTKRKISLHKME